MSNSSAFWVRPGNRLEPIGGGTSLEAPADLEQGALVWRADVNSPWVTLAGSRSPTRSLWQLLLAEGHQPRASQAAATLASQRLNSPLLGDDQRVDLTERPFFTLDSVRSKRPEHALDLIGDEAGYRIRFAVPDVSAFVSPSDCLWQEALDKGARHQVPGLRLGLLPSLLTDEALVFHPGKRRLARVIELLVDMQGHPLDVRMYRAQIINRTQVSFASAQAFFAQGNDHPLRGQPYAEALILLKTIGALRLAIEERNDRLLVRRHHVDVQMPGLAFVRVGLVQSVAELWMRAIEAVVDQEGWRWLRDTIGASELFVQGQWAPLPAEPRLEHFEHLVSDLIMRRGLSRELWQWRPGRETLASYLRRLPKAPAFRRLLTAIERQALLTQPHPVMSSKRGVTAPLADVVGLFGHLALDEHQFGPGTEVAPAITKLSSAVIEASERAILRQDRLDKATNAMVLERWFEHDLKLGEHRPWRRGTLVHAKATKLYILLDQGGFEVKVYLTALANRSASPRLSANGAQVTIGDDVFMLGDSVAIRVYDRQAAGWAFELRVDSGLARVEADK